MAYFTLSPAKIGTDIDEGNSLLVGVEGRIVAILTRLGADFHGEARGSWFVEAGFGRCAEPPRKPFKRLSDCLIWLATKLGSKPEDLHCELEGFDETFSFAKWPREE